MDELRSLGAGALKAMLGCAFVVMVLALWYGKLYWLRLALDATR